jgi:hypothetical protein
MLSATLQEIISRSRALTILKTLPSALFIPGRVRVLIAVKRDRCPHKGINSGENPY